MRYLLVIGFACDIYRREPLARIFVGDKLIDEFNIPHHKDTFDIAMKNFWQNNHILQPILNEYVTNLEIKNFPPLRFYEVDIERIPDKLELRIDINNSDSNHSNGFITRSTLLKLKVFYFFPINQKLWSRLDKIKIKNRFTKNYAWYRIKNDIINLNTYWQWHGKQGQNFYCNLNKNITSHQPGCYEIGGSGHFICELVKKYGIFIPKLVKSYRHTFNKVFINYFCNKYKQACESAKS